MLSIEVVILFTPSLDHTLMLLYNIDYFPFFPESNILRIDAMQ